MPVLSGSALRRSPVALLAVLLVLLLVMSAQVKDVQDETLLEQALLRLASPVLHVGHFAADGVKQLWHGYLHLRNLRVENDELRIELARLRREAVSWSEVEQENQRLSELLSLRLEEEIPSVAARVVAIEIGEHAATLILDQGEAAGVARNLPVVTDRGIVGRVIAVGDDFAKVQLVVDPNSGVASVVQANRLQGVVRGDGMNRAVMENVYQLEQPAPGDLVLTSGLDLLYPKRLTIGRVVSVRDSAGPIREVELETGVDFRRLEEVLVLQYRPEIEFPD